MLFFGVVGIPALVRRSRRSITLVVTPHEVRLQHSTVPWTDTLGVTLDVVARQKLVSLRLTDKGYDTLRSASSTGMRWLSSANVTVMGGPTP